jgi:hypothetical protein
MAGRRAGSCRRASRCRRARPGCVADDARRIGLRRRAAQLDGRRRRHPSPPLCLAATRSRPADAGLGEQILKTSREADPEDPRSTTSRLIAGGVPDDLARRSDQRTTRSRAKASSTSPGPPSPTSPLRRRDRRRQHRRARLGRHVPARPRRRDPGHYPRHDRRRRPPRTRPRRLATSSQAGHLGRRPNTFEIVSGWRGNHALIDEVGARAAKREHRDARLREPRAKREPGRRARALHRRFWAPRAHGRRGIAASDPILGEWFEPPSRRLAAAPDRRRGRARMHDAAVVIAGVRAGPRRPRMPPSPSNAGRRVCWPPRPYSDAPNRTELIDERPIGTDRRSDQTRRRTRTPPSQPDGRPRLDQYSSWRRIQKSESPLSLRPLGARSSSG